MLAFDTIATASGFIRDGSVRALGVTGARRSPSLPDVPAVAESIIPGFETIFWFGLMAPLRTPQPIIERLSREMAAVREVPEIVERLRSMGYEASAPGPEHFAARLSGDFEKWGSARPCRSHRNGVDFAGGRRSRAAMMQHQSPGLHTLVSMWMWCCRPSCTQRQSQETAA